MKSNVCKIEKGVRDLYAILAESERVAQYNGLNHKQTLQLRLLCEEIDGMLPKIIDDFDGEIWIEVEKGVYKVNVAIRFADWSADKKKELISVAKNKKNAAAKGIVGKIRSAIEGFFLSENTLPTCDMSLGYYSLGANYGVGADFYLWGLSQYKQSVTQEEKEEYDELEKSIIASVADDVIVGVKGRQANIVIIKKFA